MLFLNSQCPFQHRSNWISFPKTLAPHENLHLSLRYKTVELKRMIICEGKSIIQSRTELNWTELNWIELKISWREETQSLYFPCLDAWLFNQLFGTVHPKIQMFPHTVQKVVNLTNRIRNVFPYSKNTKVYLLNLGRSFKYVFLKVSNYNELHSVIVLDPF